MVLFDAHALQIYMIPNSCWSLPHRRERKPGCPRHPPARGCVQTVAAQACRSRRTTADTTHTNIHTRVQSAERPRQSESVRYNGEEERNRDRQRPRVKKGYCCSSSVDPEGVPTSGLRRLPSPLPSFRGLEATATKKLSYQITSYHITASHK